MGSLVIFERPHERFDERGLAAARLSRNHDEPGAAAARPIELLEERLQLQVAPDDRPRRARRARQDRDRRQRRRHRLNRAPARAAAGPRRRPGAGAASFCSISMISWSSVRGSSGLSSAGGSGVSHISAWSVAICDGPRNGMLPGHHLVEHDAEREDVRFGRGDLAACLLRRHVGRRCR